MENSLQRKTHGVMRASSGLPGTGVFIPLTTRPTQSRHRRRRKQRKTTAATTEADGDGMASTVNSTPTLTCGNEKSSTCDPASGCPSACPSHPPTPRTNSCESTFSSPGCSSFGGTAATKTTAANGCSSGPAAAVASTTPGSQQQQQPYIFLGRSRVDGHLSASLPPIPPAYGGWACPSDGMVCFIPAMTAAMYVQPIMVPPPAAGAAASVPLLYSMSPGLLAPTTAPGLPSAVGAWATPDPRSPSGLLFHGY